MGIPYTGAGVTASVISIDKGVMKLLFTTLRIPTPAYEIITENRSPRLPLPFVVKPANEGSTIGITVVRDKGEIPEALGKGFQYDRKLVIEEYVEGREITVGVVNGLCLPLVEVRPTKGFYDFEAKYTKGMTEYIVPAGVDKDVEKVARETAGDIYREFGLSGCVRIDMLIGKGLPQVIDINTSPGMTETSLVPKAWEHLGRTFEGLVEEILLEACLKT
jgi:D-alanine-D-alanine ligase